MESKVLPDIITQTLGKLPIRWEERQREVSDMRIGVYDMDGFASIYMSITSIRRKKHFSVKLHIRL